MYYNNTPYSIENYSESSVNKSKNSKYELMCQIQQASFAAYDLQLYLDTHPDCKEALELYTKLNATVASLRQDYENYKRSKIRRRRREYALDLGSDCDLPIGRRSGIPSCKSSERRWRSNVGA